VKAVLGPGSEVVGEFGVVELGPEKPAPEMVINAGRGGFSDPVLQFPEVLGPEPRGEGDQGTVPDDERFCFHDLTLPRR